MTELIQAGALRLDDIPNGVGKANDTLIYVDQLDGKIKRSKVSDLQVSPQGDVYSVNGKQGNVIIDAVDVGALPKTYVPSYNALTNVPAEFTPKAHTHQVSQVANAVNGAILKLQIRQPNDLPAGFDVRYQAGGSQVTGGAPGIDHSVISMSFDGDLWANQLAADWRTGKWWTRSKADGTWGPWGGVYTSNNKPSLDDMGAAPKTHNHTWSNISDAPVYTTRWPNTTEVGLSNYKNTPATPHGSVEISGQKGSYAGIHFSDYKRTLMMNSNVSGVYSSDTNAWQWYFTNDTLTAGKIPWARIPDAPVYTTRWPTAAEAGSMPGRSRTDWEGSGVENNVVGQLAWKNYGNNHTIFDASAGTTPTGAACDKTNSAQAWSPSYPTLMGSNGGTTHGVRVDSARVADNANNANTAGGLAVGTGVNNAPNQIVRTNASGYIDAGWINTVSGTASGTPIRIYCSEDSYLRYYSPAQVAPYILTQGSTKNAHTHNYMEDNGTYNTITLGNWIRTTGNTGWFNATYGGGIHMEDTTWIRTYNGKQFHVANTANNALDTAGGVTAQKGFYDAGSRVYSPGNKPSPAEIGAAPVAHSHTWGQIGGVPNASLTGTGVVQLSNAFNSNSQTVAATSYAVSVVGDKIASTERVARAVESNFNTRCKVIFDNKDAPILVTPDVFSLAEDHGFGEDAMLRWHVVVAAVGGGLQETHTLMTRKEFCFENNIMYSRGDYAQVSIRGDNTTGGPRRTISSSNNNFRIMLVTCESVNTIA